ncbi:type II toxin-antitoxin system YafQ family toxin [Candidatus Regiella endosymbiont of Tuberolachnus salignus]|uniref:type II toxin-antitoxin system RelE/ParE family toxin n=1 Tax=Candidatus Regiella endosymbiont of Tuberolachnus salignus TaxID=3077956 RepID=UPI0030CEE993
MLTIVYQNQFKKDAKRYVNNKKSKKVILDTIALLQTGNALPSKYREHQLIGKYIGYLECHGSPDILLIYRRTHTELKLYRVGSHAELF